MYTARACNECNAADSFVSSLQLYEKEKELKDLQKRLAEEMMNDRQRTEAEESSSASSKGEMHRIPRGLLPDSFSLALFLGVL